MKKLFQLVKDHIEDDFNPAYYATVIIFLTGSIWLNYTINLENGIIDKYVGNPVRIVYYFILYASGFYAACGFVSFFRKDSTFWKSGRFWLLSLIGLVILSIDRGFPYMGTWMTWLNQPYVTYVWIFKVSNNILSYLLVTLTLLIFYITLDKRKSGFYGLTTHGNLRPYLTLLICIAPLILVASFQENFTNYYPRYKPNEVAAYWDWPEFLPMIIFEFFYGADFLNVELLFRGFFVIGMAQVLGKNSILPMVVIYCFLHFGKPVGETISSVVGGYVLGIIAYYTRSIWGGILVHVGVAWMMEAGAYFAKQF